MALDLNDKTGNGHTLTNNGASEYTADLPFPTGNVRAADLEASENDFLTTPDAADLSVVTTGQLSIEFWVKVESLASINYIFCKSASTDQFEYQITVGTSGQVDLSFWSLTGSSRYRYVTNNSVIGTGTWIHIAVTVDDTGAFNDANCKLYINGSESTNISSGNSAATLANSTSPLNIGKRDDFFSTGYYDGIIDDVRVWSDVRTGTEINNNKSVELTGTEANLIAYWPFEALGGVTRRFGTLSMMGVGN